MDSEVLNEDEVEFNKQADKDFNHWLGTRLFATILIIVICIVFCTSQYVRSSNPTDYVVTVVDKVPKASNSSSKDLVYCETSDGSTIKFEDTRMLLQGKKTQQEFFDALKIGDKYIIRAVGVEVPLFSNFRNIVDIQERN